MTTAVIPKSSFGTRTNSIAQHSLSLTTVCSVLLRA
jgi:hypothetical protein